MLFKEKKPSEYTKGRGRQEHTETDTHHRPKLAVHGQGHLTPRQGPGGGRAEGWPGRTGSLWAVHIGAGQDWTELGRSHTVRGVEHLTEARPRPADTATGAWEESRHQVAYKLKLETGP